MRSVGGSMRSVWGSMRYVGGCMRFKSVRGHTGEG